MADIEPALLDKWLVATTEREKAVLEKEIWESVKEVGRNRRDFLSKLLSVSPSTIDGRAYLLAHDVDVSELWKRIEAKQMNYGMACKFIRRAKMEIGHFPIVLGKAIAAYDMLPVGVVIKGVPIRRTFPGKAKPKEGYQAKLFWKKIRQDVETYLSAECIGFDPPTTAEVRSHVFTDLDTFLKGMQSKFSRARNRAKGAEAVDRILKSDTDVRNACAVLNLDRPRKLDAEFLKKARSQRNAFVRVFHPDTGGVTAIRRSIKRSLKHLTPWMRPSRPTTTRSPGE
jgi:hypothetical protein